MVYTPKNLPVLKGGEKVHLHGELQNISDSAKLSSEKLAGLTESYEAHTHDVAELGDVSAATPAEGDVLRFVTDAWVTSPTLTAAEAAIVTLNTDLTTLESAAVLKATLTTRGDLLVRGASAPERLPLGAADTIVSSDGTDTLLRTKAQLNVASLDTENQPCTGGLNVAWKSLGTITTGTLTLDMGDRQQQNYVNGGAHELLPGSIDGSLLLDIVNNSGAGVIALSGWLVDGDDLTLTDGDKFRCHASLGPAGALLAVKAMQ